MASHGALVRLSGDGISGKRCSPRVHAPCNTCPSPKSPNFKMEEASDLFLLDPAPSAQCLGSRVASEASELGLRFKCARDGRPKTHAVTAIFALKRRHPQVTPFAALACPGLVPDQSKFECTVHG